MSGLSPRLTASPTFTLTNRVSNKVYVQLSENPCLAFQEKGGNKFDAGKGKKLICCTSDVATVPITVRASVSTKSITILTSLLD